MQNETIKIFASLLLFWYSTLPLSGAEKPNSKPGAWVLVKTIDDNDTSMKSNNIYSIKSNFNRGSIMAGWNCISGSAKGENLTVSFAWEAPPKTIQAGESVKIKVSVVPKANKKPTLPGTISAFVYFDAPGLEPGKTTSKIVSFYDSKGSSSSKCTSAGGKQMSSLNVVVTGKAFGTPKKGDKMSLYYGVYGWGIGSEYAYEWQ